MEEVSVPHRRRFLERHLPPLIDVSELSDDEVDIAFEQIVSCELDAAPADVPEPGDSSDAPDTACPPPKSRRPNKR